MKKVLLIRLDKIGDLICTLCVDQVSFLKDCEVQWVISKGLGFVPDHADPKRKYVELSKENWKDSIRILRKFLQEYKPDVAVSFQAPWWVSFALWAERVPVRAGVQSQWHSFLFLNRGLRQRRSQATQHEADYNLDLLLHAFEIEESLLQEKTPILTLTAPDNLPLLDKYQLNYKNYVVVHPGMAGSALNWPTPNYIQLIQELIKTTRVVLTGTPPDEPWLKDIKATFQNHPQVLCLQNQLKAPELLTILRNAKAVIAPSTGVAHIAASMGTPVLGIYSPIRVQHPRRWAARGPDVRIFVPEEPDMSQIKVEDLLKALSSI